MNRRKWQNRGELFLSIVYLAIIPVFFMIQIKRWTAVENIQYCLNDVYCYAQYYETWITLPLVQLIVIQNIKCEFRVNVVIRIQDMYKFWIRLVKKILRISAIYTVYTWICVTLVGLNYAEFNCNWNQENSYVYAKTGGAKPVSVFYMMLFFLLLFMVYSMVWAMLITIIWWNTLRPIIGVGLMILMLVLERGLRPSAFRLFFSVLNLDIDKVYTGFPFQLLWWYSWGVLVLVFIAGFFSIRKKDFLRKDEG